MRIFESNRTSTNSTKKNNSDEIYRAGIIVHCDGGTGHRIASLQILEYFFFLEKQGTLRLPKIVPVCFEIMPGLSLDSVNRKEIPQELEFLLNYFQQSPLKQRLVFLPIMLGGRFDSYYACDQRGSYAWKEFRRGKIDLKIHYLFSGGGSYCDPETQSHKFYPLLDQRELYAIVQLQPFQWFKSEQPQVIYYFDYGNIFKIEPIDREMGYIPIPDIHSFRHTRDEAVEGLQTRTIKIMFYDPPAMEERSPFFEYLQTQCQKILDQNQNIKIELNMILRHSDPKLTSNERLTVNVWNRLDKNEYLNLLGSSDIVLAEGRNTITQASQLRVPYIHLSAIVRQGRATDMFYPPIGTIEAPEQLQALSNYLATSYISVSATGGDGEFPLDEVLMNILNRGEDYQRYYEALSAHLVDPTNNLVDIAMLKLKFLEQSSDDDQTNHTASDAQSSNPRSSTSLRQ